jgi:hypothetical protein
VLLRRNQGLSLHALFPKAVDTKTTLCGNVSYALHGRGAKGEAEMERPAVCTDEHLKYLDVLRETGITNMFGARPYLVNAFTLTKQEAGEVLSYWMATFPRVAA